MLPWHGSSSGTVAERPEFQPRRLLEVLVVHEVDFVPIGGLAGVVHGSFYPSFDVEGVAIRVCSLDHLIAMKEAAGRPKDLLMASEYRLISDELRRPRDG